MKILHGRERPKSLEAKRCDIVRTRGGRGRSVALDNMTLRGGHYRVAPVRGLFGRERKSPIGNQ